VSKARDTPAPVNRPADENPPVEQLPNIGPAIARTLHGLGIKTKHDLARVGPVAVWQALCAAEPGKTVPLCYYLYSLEGALRGCHWNALPRDVKDALAAEAREGVTGRGESSRAPCG